MLNIVFLDSETLNHNDISWVPIKEYGILRTFPHCSSQEIVEKGGDAEIIITNKVHFTEREFSLLPKLKLLCVAATGYDVIDIKAARNHNVLVCNCAEYGTHAVAQMAVALLLEACNHVGHYVEAVIKGKVWCKSPTFSCWDKPLVELRGRKVAIIGYGHIGKELGNILYALGMNIYAVSQKSQDMLPAYVKKIGINEAFKCCDVVSLNCPLTPQNRGMINWQILSTARKGIILVNTARGGLVEEPAIRKALETGILSAYCTDVLACEPPSFDSEILSAPNAYITPHVAWATIESRTRLVNILADNIRCFLEGHPINVVN